RKEIFEKVLDKLEHFYVNTKEYSTTPTMNIPEIKEFVEQSDLSVGGDYKAAIDHITTGLEKYSVHTLHPKYFGLYNPRPNYAGILADLISAYYNPQLAAWSHAPFAVEVEARLIKEFSEKFGYSSSKNDGVFATGGNEANQTAVLCALNHKYPNFARDGLIGIQKKPIIFCSAEAHHSVHKAAKTAGLGYNSVRSIPTDVNQKLDIKILEKEIKAAIQSNDDPLMIIGTAGTTGSGIVDDLVGINHVAKRYDVWFHVDAAYGGAAILSDKLKSQLNGIEHSNSITFDAHKWMSVPMGTSLFLTSEPHILAQTFSISTQYMPKDADELEIVDPFSHSIQWSRRFIGLKLYLSLLFYGWDGYDEVISHQAEMGDLLREKLTDNGWSLLNNTKLPVLCFTDEKFAEDENFTAEILKNIYKNGQSWLSVYPIGNIKTFRVCISNYNTTELELDELVAELNHERENYAKRNI
ncbi:MAG: aminotransferase class V-fold PLP-dependent enzyme, partial [Emcibacteraceae bacterium]|nr:aminotransferase class V-fold PLP-dependent enzyme [Emcibacteraceae bacterium]